jgi:hypothetical protein
LRDAVEKIILLREWNKILKDSIEKKISNEENDIKYWGMQLKR